MATLFFGSEVGETLEVCPSCPETTLCADPLSDDPNCIPPATAVALTVEPALITADVGSDVAFRSFAEFSDGRQRDVTLESEWSSSAPIIALNRGDGIYSALEAGTVNAVANWGGMEASGQLTVVAPCRDVPLDVVMVVEVSGWMTQDLWNAAKSITYALRLGGKEWDDPRPNLDRIAVISFATTPTVVQEFTSDVPFDAFDFELPLIAYRTAPGAALQTAYNLLQRDARPDARQLVIILFSGLESSCTPAVRDMADVMKQNSVLIAAIGGRPAPRVIHGWNGETTVLNIGSGIDCTAGSGSIAASQVVEAVASSGMAFIAESVGDIMAILSRIPSSTCGNLDGTGMPTYDPDPPVIMPDCPPGYVIEDFNSSYVWSIDPGQNPNDLLTGEQLSMAMCVFGAEVNNFIQGIKDLGGDASVVGAYRWVSFFTGGNDYSGLRKSTCDPLDGIDDFLIGGTGNNVQALAVAICRTPAL